MTFCEILWCIIGGVFALYGAANALFSIVTKLLYPQHQRVWAIIPLRGRVDNPEALLHHSSVSRLYERGFDHVWYVDAGMDRESKTRCEQLTASGRFPPIFQPKEFAELLHFPSE